LKHLDIEYSKLQLGRANPVMIEGIMVEQYSALQKIQNMAAISNMDSQTLIIKPWDRTVIHAIAKAISNSGL
jgi:ribosome recycling factor